MVNIIVVDNPKHWPLHIPGVALVTAQHYLTQTHYSELRNAKVVNLCRSYRYQSTGYYVSLLAMSRGHKPVPSITTIQDVKSLAIARTVAEDLDPLIQRSLRPIKSDRFTLSIYFGRNLAKRYDELSSRLFRLFPVPLLRAEFRCEDGEWRIQGIRPIAASDIPATHRDFVVRSAESFFAANRMPFSRRNTTFYDLAILHNPEERRPPSGKKALARFAKAARRCGLAVEFIERDDFGRLAEFDALFIRETTLVNHHTYRFARRAAAEGLVVIDDPESIAKCTNKVYLAELLARYRIAIPRTMIVHRDNRDEVAGQIGLPCILKQPDSSFSQGVLKAEDSQQLEAMMDQLMDKSDLIIAQEFVPTEFDWRIGVLDRQPLYACQYYMVKEHWQIAKNEGLDTSYGDIRAVPLEAVPPAILKTAVRAANLIGDGLYGVDVKDIQGRGCVIEINDNPSIDAGCEDEVMGSSLYEKIMSTFVTRIQKRKNGALRGTA